MQSGYSLDDAATVLACHRWKISRMETGRRGVGPADLCGLPNAYGTDEAHRDTLYTLAERLHDARWWQSQPRHRRLPGFAAPGRSRSRTVDSSADARCPQNTQFCSVR
jgi:hypothetical protein